MARTAPSITAALAIVAGAAEPPTSPLSPRTREALRRAVERARAEILAAVERDGVVVTAEALGVSRSTLALWRAQGWLRSAQEPGAGAP